VKRLEYIGIKDVDKPFRLENGHDFRVHLNLLPPGRYITTVQKEYKKATHSQFKWLFGGIYPEFLIALNDAGYEFTNVDEVDLFAKSLWANKKVLNQETGELIKIPMSKAEFLTIDHQAFVANIRYYAAVYLNTEISEPDINWKQVKAEMQLLINKQKAA
jgi:hypothetical protein